MSVCLPGSGCQLLYILASSKPRSWNGNVRLKTCPVPSSQEIKGECLRKPCCLVYSCENGDYWIICLLTPWLLLLPVKALLHSFLPTELQALLWKALYEYVGECPWHEELTVWGVIRHAAGSGKADTHIDWHQSDGFKCKERHCYKKRVWVCSSYFCSAQATGQGTSSIKETWLEHKARKQSWLSQNLTPNQSTGNYL